MLATVLALALAPARLRAQVNPPGTGATPVPQPQRNVSPQGQRAPGYSVTRKLSTQPPPTAMPEAATESLRAWEGLQVEAVEFEGVDRARLEPLPQSLALQPHKPLRAEDVRQSLRRLYATGLYKGIAVEGKQNGNQVMIRFQGTPQQFLGRVTVEDLKDDRLASQLQRSTRLTAGTRYDQAKMQRAGHLLTDTLQANGYYSATFKTTTTEDQANALVNVEFHVTLGKKTRVGTVEATGDPGMSLEQFRKKAKLKAGSKVTRDTVSRALSNLRKYYEKKKRLEATVALESKQFQPAKNLLDLKFHASQGPLVAITVSGVKLSNGKVKSLVPVFEEGTVDEDLLNEGDRRIRDYYQRQGYFDTHVTHTRSTQGTDAKAHTEIVFNVKLGVRQEVKSVTVAGNHYFSDSVILPRLSVDESKLLMPHGHYSQALAEADSDTIEALYQSNGFSSVSVTPVVKANPKGPGNKVESLSVKYQVVEGTQDRIGKYEITGNKKVPLSALQPLLTTESGQPYSSTTIMGDRDAVLTYYYSHGFDHAAVKLAQTPEPDKPDVIDITMQVTEGEQIFVNRVLVSGLHYTRPSTVQPRILLEPGQPLNQSALLETQRQLYDLTLFNEVNTAVQNPRGDLPRKNVLLHFTEAKRWDLSYGVGFQAQTGNPETNCPNPISLIQLGINPAQYEANCGSNGKTGASALVLFDISRINLWGRNQSITLRTQYGSLEQSATTIYSLPHIFNLKSVDFSLSGGYTNAQDVTTYAASRLEGTVRFTHRLDRANTLFYQFTYRRVKVDPNSVQVSPRDIPLVSEPVRVGGPGFTWIRDTRRPNPLDAIAGTYTSMEEFATDNIFESQANFNRLDLSNSSYYQIGKRHFVLARNTRFGYERAFGEGKYEYIPLPERLYAGGAQSLRAYSINAAGPRDSLTGFPIGGAGVFVNSEEIRFPNPTLPYFGNALGFVLFHDMGNVFNNSSDIWPSALRIKQPHSFTCKDLDPDHQKAVTRSSSTNTTGTCDFNYFTHGVGLGLRYHTPIGPIRLDFSYTLNPPIYPVILTYGTHSDGLAIQPYVGQAPHFNFFFSIGQAF
ncbi:MAG: POTRA domain-containing protein [Acidobacteriaceae bacterium]